MLCLIHLEYLNSNNFFNEQVEQLSLWFLHIFVVKQIFLIVTSLYCYFFLDNHGYPMPLIYW